MLSTSLQNIVAGDSCAKERGDITCLFLNKQYPTFQLAELQDSPLLTLPIFSTLLGVLLQWNQMAHSLPVHSDALYSRNRFIFFMLKSIAKGSERTSRVHLEKLFNWYNSNRQEQVQFLRRKSGFRAMVDEEWEIRKTYKSNLPLELGTYKRRCVEQQNQMDGSEGWKVTDNERKQQGGYSNRNHICRDFTSQSKAVLLERERRELASTECAWKKSSANRIEKQLKNYYLDEFSNLTINRDRKHIVSDLCSATNKLKMNLLRKTMGERTWRKGDSRGSVYDFPTVNSKPKPARIHTELVEANEFQPISDIEGINLMSNPFEIKLKKKKP